MLPPSFIDFALSRNLADGVFLAGCADGDCYFRLGDQWTRERVAGTRDPYLRKRVDRDRLQLGHFRSHERAQRQASLAEFSSSLTARADDSPERESS
jgi:coenzyme F420-reducing hydrogenase delta subunit